jgi:hypothetical protein
VTSQTSLGVCPDRPRLLVLWLVSETSSWTGIGWTHGRGGKTSNHMVFVHGGPRHRGVPALDSGELSRGPWTR